MTLGTAVALLLLTIAGIVTACICFRRKALRWGLVVLLSLILLALLGYIGLTLLFVDAVSRQLPG